MFDFIIRGKVITFDFIIHRNVVIIIISAVRPQSTIAAAVLQFYMSLQ